MQHRHSLKKELGSVLGGHILLKDVGWPGVFVVVLDGGGEKDIAAVDILY